MTIITQLGKLTSNLRDIYTVSRLNQETQLLLESHFTRIWISGEISNLGKAASGHYYFSLKDANASVRCVYFRNRHISPMIEPVSGMQILALAKVSLYINRGDYQLIIESFQDAGVGLLQIEFDILKQKLANLGLFEDKHKKAIPLLPRCVGVITSPQGAALRDILITLNNRFCSIPVIIYPTEVQGKTAAAKIAAAIEIANLRHECDVLIVARGGGSLEDLWAFNEEIVATAIFASKIPIVCGIGHQTDRTIADFVADLATATPTAAAAAVCPNLADYSIQFSHLIARINYAIERKINTSKTTLLHLKNSLKDPGIWIKQQWQTLDGLHQNMHNFMQTILTHKNIELTALTHELIKKHPRTRLKEGEHQLRIIQQRLEHAMNDQLLNKRQWFTHLLSTLNAVSPLATLERGYAIAMTKDHHVLNSNKNVKVADEIILKLAHGGLVCSVIDKLDGKA